MTSEREVFESTVRALEAEIANAGVHMTIDAQARRTYARLIREMSDELREAAQSGRITWAQAAEQAQHTRNVVMELVRGRSTPIGRALAEQLKREGRTLNELIARKTQQMYGARTDFRRLGATEQNAVYAEIVKSAGKSNPRITATMRHISRAGRGLIVFSIGMSVYTVAAAENHGQAAGRELLVTGAGIAGGVGGGALAGLACGPGAPVCVTVGAFIGGAMAAFGVDYLW